MKSHRIDYPVSLVGRTAVLLSHRAPSHDWPWIDDMVFESVGHPEVLEWVKTTYPHLQIVRCGEERSELLSTLQPEEDERFMHVVKAVAAADDKQFGVPFVPRFLVVDFENDAQADAFRERWVA